MLKDDDEIKGEAKTALRDLLNQISWDIYHALKERYGDIHGLPLSQYDRVKDLHETIFSNCVANLKEELYKLAVKSQIKAIAQEDDL